MVVFFCLAGLFLVQNWQMLGYRLQFRYDLGITGVVSQPLPIYMLLFCALILGALITLIVGAIDIFRLKSEAGRKDKTIRELQKELGTLKSSRSTVSASRPEPEKPDTPTPQPPTQNA